MTSAHNHSKSDGGFTLVEILVAAAIFAVTLAAMATVLFSAMSLHKKTTDSINRLTSANLLSAVIKRDLQNMIPPGENLAGSIKGDKGSIGLNRGDQLQFYTSTGTLVTGEPWSEIQQVTYSLGESTNRTQTAAGYDFVRSVRRNLLSLITAESSEEHLSGNIKSLQFQYYDGTESTWKDSWDSETMESKIPRAVKVAIEFIDTNQPPEIIAPLEMTIQVLSQPLTNSTATNTESSTTSAGESSNSGNQSGGGR